MACSNEAYWLDDILFGSTKAENAMYSHWLSLRDQEPPSKLIHRYKSAFILGSYEDQNIHELIGSLLEANKNGRSLQPVINYSAYILVNYWSLDHANHSAINELVDLFDNLPKSANGQRRRQLLKVCSEYIKTDDFKGLQQFAETYRQDSFLDRASSIRSTLSRFPCLYESPEMIPSAWKKYQKGIIRELRSEKEAEKEAILLPYYHSFRNGEQIIVNGSDILLSGDELRESFRVFTGKVDQNGSHKHSATIFAKQVRAEGYFSSSLVNDFCHFLMSPIYYLIKTTASPGRRKDIQIFGQRLKAQLRQFLASVLPHNRTLITAPLLQNLCRRVLNFLTIDESNKAHRKEHQIFLQMHEFLGSASLVGILLRIALFYRPAKGYMENCLGRMFKQYENRKVDDAKIQWLLPVLEHTNVAFATNFGQYAFKDYQFEI